MYNLYTEKSPLKASFQALSNASALVILFPHVIRDLIFYDGVALQLLASPDYSQRL